jgi:hypothetical protein
MGLFAFRACFGVGGEPSFRGIALSHPGTGVVMEHQMG